MGFGYLAHFWQVVSGEAFRLGNEKILSHLQKGEWLGIGHSCMAGIHCSLEIMGCMSIDKIFREVLFALLCLIRKKPRTNGQNQQIKRAYTELHWANLKICAYQKHTFKIYLKG